MTATRFCEKPEKKPCSGDGGADRDRTCDLLIANETLYQLSYDPIHHRPATPLQRFWNFFRA